MTGNQLKFGFHDFINAQPLLIPLKEREQQLGITLVTGSPAVLADQLGKGQLDLAMIPSIEYLKEAGRYRLLPGIAVASRGPVDTVLLASRRPLAEVRSVALDQRSRTSAALLQVLFGDELPSGVTLQPADPDPVTMLKNHDAALIIGDPAFGLRAQFPDLEFYDLSERWFQQTGKTFVHALVAVRNGMNLDQLFLNGVREAREEGQSRLSEIARTESERSGIAYEVCLDYLSSKIIYDLGEGEMDGLRHFGDICFERGILEQKETIQFVEV